jgi:putative sporulation protein YyaC
VSETHYINAADKPAAQQVGIILSDCFQKYSFNHIVFLCIGTDRATGDSLGPIVGYKLKNSLAERLINMENIKAPRVNSVSFAQSNVRAVSVFGTLEKPVHAKNIEQTLNYINAVFDDPFIAAVDASLGRTENVGYVTISESALAPGAGLSKDLPSVGRISITGIVNVSDGMDFSILQNTRLNLVMKMSEVIHDGILSGLERFFTKAGSSSEFML